MRLSVLLTLAVALAAGPAAAQGALDRLRETGEIRLGYRLDALPLSYADDGGVPSGYTVQVCEEVAEKLRVALGLDALDATLHAGHHRGSARRGGERRHRPALRRDHGHPDPARDRRFLDPDLRRRRRGAAPEGGRLGHRLARGQEASASAPAPRPKSALRKSLEAEQVEAEIVTFDDHAAGRDALAAGDIAAYFGDQSILIGLIVTSADRDAFVLSNEMLTVEKQALALARGDTDFRLAVDRALSELYISGRMQELLLESLPGLEPGLALRAMFLIAPDLE